MRKPVAIILMAFMVLSLGFIPGVKAATVPTYASISGISLELGDKAILGPYNVTFVDVNLAWTQVYLQVTGPEGTKTAVLNISQSLVYPSPTNVMLNVTLNWIRSDTKSIIITISSPLTKLYSNKAIPVGTQFTLPEGFPPIKVKLESVSSTGATFLVTMPYGAQYTLSIPKGEARGVSYQIDSIHSYINYLYIEVVNVTSNQGAVINLYVPRVATTNLRIVSPNQAQQSTAQTPEVSTTLLYDGLLYTGEKLQIKDNGTSYYFQLVSVIPDMVRMTVYRENKTIGTYTLEVGGLPRVVDGSPFMVSVQRAEPQYKRALVRIYGPINAEVVPILRSANVTVNITAVPKQVLVGQDIVLSIGVENLGRGDAYQLNVAAPIPSGFKLVSMTKSWQINTLPAFTKLPMLVYVLKPLNVGKFDIGKVMVTYYDDQSLETGKMKTVYSAPLTNVIVYGIPQLTFNAAAYNGTWGTYVTAKPNQTVKLAVTISASSGNPAYEFVKNATLYLTLPKGVKGASVLKVGDIKAGEKKTVVTDLKVTAENLSHVSGVLIYYDPLGNEHRITLGNLVTIDSIPPKVIVKEVKVWPKPDELPQYINQTLAKMENATPLAEQIAGVVSQYLPPKNQSNPWKPLTVLFLITTLVAGAVAYNYYSQLERLKQKVLRKKQRRPGGLPKKEEEEELEL